MFDKGPKATFSIPAIQTVSKPQEAIMVRQRRQGGAWYFQFIRDGKPYRGRCEGATTKREAEAFEKKIIVDRSFLPDQTVPRRLGDSDYTQARGPDAGDQRERPAFVPSHVLLLRWTCRDPSFGRSVHCRPHEPGDDEALFRPRHNGRQASWHGEAFVLHTGCPPRSENRRARTSRTPADDRSPADRRSPRLA